MKKSIKMLKILSLCLAPICMSGCAFGGGSNNNNNNNQQSGSQVESNKEVAVTEVTLDKTEVDMKVGSTISLKATVIPDNATKPGITWTSSKTSVAKVDDGVVEAIGVGTAIIKAKTSNGKYAECTVTVTDNSVTSVTLNVTECSLEVKTTLQLSAAILPEDAEDKTITWKSSSSAKATVNDAGLVTAVSKGTATITATAANGKKATCKITVVDYPVIVDKKFSNNCTYIYSGTFEFMGNSVEYDTRYTFKTDGTATITDVVKSTTKNRTYKVDDGMLFIYDGETLEDKFFYYNYVLLSASVMPVTLIKDGSGISESGGTGLLGYYAIIETSVNSSLGVLTGEEGSAGYYVKLQKNGKLVENRIEYVKGDQISSSAFDENVKTKGTYIVKINIGGTLYNCLLIVK